MSTIYWVNFDDGALVSVASADAKSRRAKHLLFAYRRARQKATTIRRKTNPKARAVKVRCVG